MKKFKIGDIVKIKRDDYKDVVGTVYHIESMGNITVKPDMIFIEKYYDVEIIITKIGRCVDNDSLWFYDGGSIYGSKPEIISNAGFCEDELLKRIRSTKLSRKLFKNAEEDDGWLWV